MRFTDPRGGLKLARTKKSGYKVVKNKRQRLATNVPVNHSDTETASDQSPDTGTASECEMEIKEHVHVQTTRSNSMETDGQEGVQEITATKDQEVIDEDSIGQCQRIIAWTKHCGEPDFIKNFSNAIENSKIKDNNISFLLFAEFLRSLVTTTFQYEC